MSRAALFVFIEGREDRYFYSRLLTEITSTSLVEFSLVVADELPTDSAGKPCLENFHELLRRQLELDSTFKGKRTIAVFIADKDLDDYLRRKRRTGHFLYTEGYDLDNLLFENGDIADCLSAAAGLALPGVRAALANRDWCREASQTWLEWTEICFAATVYGWRCAGNYGRPSPIHDPTARLNTAARAGFVGALLISSGLPKPSFDKKWLSARKRVASAYARDEHHRVFKGKWFRILVEREAAAIAAGQNYDRNGLGQRTVAMLAMTVDLSLPWIGHVRRPLEDVVARLEAA